MVRDEPLAGGQHRRAGFPRFAHSSIGSSRPWTALQQTACVAPLLYWAFNATSSLRAVPTGFLHIGSARTFIFNWLYARHHGGAMILRIDDTDVERNTQSSLDSIFDGLRWLDLGWDEQYRQS